MPCVKNLVLRVTGYVVALIIAGCFSVLTLAMGEPPKLIYQAVTGALVALLGVLIWTKEQKKLIFLVATLIWYALFWVVRDAIVSPWEFTEPGTDLQNYISLYPVTVAMLYAMMPLGGPWWSVMLSVALAGLTVLMGDTANEVLAAMTLAGFIVTKRDDVRIMACGFMWYQVWLAASKYVNFFDSALLYSWALTPYLASILLVMWRRLDDEVRR